ncbi:MAG: site-specific integrase, partial [Prevotella sp.]|nr:site-specific integrase [Prevotella sp.]
MDVERQYMRYLKLQRNYSPNTLEAYRHDLDYLLSYCRKNDKDPLDMKLEDLQHFAATIHEYG